MKRLALLGQAAEAMASVVADEEGAYEPALREAAIFRNGELESDCKLFHLDVSESGVAKAITHLIPITVTESNKLLVAVPLRAWHRQLSRRFLPRNGLSKPVCVEVPGLFPDTDEEAVLKVWVGFLSEELIPGARFGRSSFDEALGFVDEHEQVVEPLAQSLVDVANDQFGFFSAASQTSERVPECPYEEPLVDRVAGLEDQLLQIKGMIEGLSQNLKPKTDIHVAKPKAVPVKYQGLDPGMLASARAAGVPEEHLRRLSNLAQKPNNMEDVPVLRGRRKNVLSESEDEEAEVEEAEVDESSPHSAVEKAVLQLTKLVTTMSKKKRRAGAGLESILDKTDAAGSGEASSSSHGSRSKAAAYVKLKAALTEKPEWIYQSIEERLEEDFGAMRSAPSSQTVAASARGWLEYRSKLGHYPSTIRFSWILAGALDNLRQGEVSQARARLALALAAVDQAALDGGSWSLASEFLLEVPPPFSSFQNRRAPDPSEQVATRLVEDRFLDVMLWRIRDRDSYLESRKRLAASAKARQQPGPDAPPGGPPYPTPKPKGKAKSQPAAQESAGGNQ